MGRLVDCDKVFNAIQITTDNFGVVKHVVESNMQTMLSKIPTVRAIRIPEGATNGDMVEKIFGKDVYCTLIRMMYSSCCEKLKDWWDSPYKKEGEQE